MTVFLNGQFVPGESALASILDRGFTYGDGVFETLRISLGRPFRWEAHAARLETGAAFLGIRLPFLGEELRKIADQLIARNGLPEAMLRLAVSRGPGKRGYSPKGADSPTVVMTVHPLPEAKTEGLRVVLSEMRLYADDSLLRHKTSNKLLQVLARREADRNGADEALLLNHRGEVATASSANLFWVKDGTIWTPPASCGALPGITRDVVRELCGAAAIPFAESAIAPEDLQTVDGVFLTSSGLGIASVAALNGRALKIPPVVDGLRSGYAQVLQLECQP